MIYYHCLPKKYFDLQTITGDWVPKYGSTWLADSDKHAYQASQINSEIKVIVRFELDDDLVEDHSDMDICKRLGRSYYLYRGNIPKNRFQIHIELEAAS